MADKHPDHEFETFELLVGPREQGAGYRLTVLQSPAGEANAYCRIDPSNAELQDALWVIRHEEIEAAFLQEIGSFLYEELFVDDVAALLRTSMGMARSDGRALRIRLRIEAPELQMLPWEYLHDPQEDASLAIRAETALVRYLPLRLPVRPTRLDLPLRILVVIANPADTEALDIERERTIIQEALAAWTEQGKVVVEVLERATVPAINEAMRRFQPHVFHFIGHGFVDTEQAYIVLEDAAGNRNPVDERTFREFFSACRETRLVVLNACQTATISSTEPLVGIAPQLLQRQLSAVVAMQAPILDQASVVFAREFYRCLALGYPIDAAVSEARKGIYMELGAHEPAWGVPILFLRAKDGRLFVLDEPETPAVEIPPPPEPQTPPQIPDFVGRAAEIDQYVASLRDYGIAVIAGMAGLGKSSLAAEVARAFGRPEKTFWHTFHLDESIETIIWKLAGFLAWHGRSDLWTMLQSAAQTGGKPPPPDVLFDYLIQLLRGQDYLICLDDFQRVDDDPLLDRLTERLRPLLRAGELRILLTSRRIPDFVQVAVAPLDGLSLADTRRLLAARSIALSDNMTEELHARLEGNAELLILTIEALQKSMEPERLLANLVEAANIERYLLNEIDRDLRDDERRVMNGVAALMGYPGTRDAIEETLGGVNARRHLSYLTNRYLLQQFDGEHDREYGQHAIVQAFYYDLLSRRERQAMHRRAAEYYELDEQDHLRAAIHYERAGEHEQAAELATKDIVAAMNTGRSRQAADLLERLATRPMTANLQVALLLNLASLHGFLGERRRAEERFQAALERLQHEADKELDDGLTVEAYLGLGQLWLMDNPQEALGWIELGLGHRGLIPSSPVEASLLVAQGTAQMYLGRYEESLAATRRGLALLPEERFDIRIEAMLNITHTQMLQGNLEEANANAVNTLQLARAAGDNHRQHKALHNLATVQMFRGAWDDAVNNYEESATIAERLGDEDGALFSRTNLCLLMIERGEWDAAEEAVAYTLTHSGQRELLLERLSAALFAAMLDSSRYGRHMQAYNQAVAVAAEATVQGVESAVVFSLWLQAMFLGRAGQFDSAERRAREAMALADRLGERTDYAIAMMELGKALAAQNGTEEAERALTESLALLESDGDIYQSALCRYELGLLLAQNGRRDEAVSMISAAAQTLQRLRARPAVEALYEHCKRLAIPISIANSPHL